MFACDEFRNQATLAVEELAALASSTHPLQVWPATGAPRATQDELLEARAHLVAAAREHGWPAPLGRDEQRDVDLAIARVLTERTSLTPAEAGFGDAWSFLALVLVPDVVWWRAGGSTNIERFVATDLTRHTLARLWWRAHLFTWGLEDPETGWELWRSSAIGEADLDQIQTRRGGYGRSPKMFRALVRTYPLVTSLAAEAGLDRRDVWRQSFLRWVLRLGAFTNFNALSDADLDQDLAAILGRDGHATHETEAADTEPPDAPEPGEFDAQPLRTIVVRLAETVRVLGRVPEGELCSALESVAGIVVPATRRDIVSGIAWQGKALDYLDNSEDEGVRVWSPGSVLPAPDRRWGEWTFDSFKEHVAERDGDADVDQLAAELFAGRAGRTIRRLVRAAIRETGERP
jgi:hypothetical protein